MDGHEVIRINQFTLDEVCLILSKRIPVAISVVEEIRSRIKKMKKEQIIEKLDEIIDGLYHIQDITIERYSSNSIQEGIVMPGRAI